MSIHFLIFLTSLKATINIITIFTWRMHVTWTCYMFFFLLFSCQTYLGLRNCKSVFLILEISQYGGSRRWVQLFATYPCKIWYKNWYLKVWCYLQFLKNIVYVYYIFTENVYSACNPMQVAFLQTCINFGEQRLKFSQFEGSIIP